ncbi:aspartate/glutamate racemase family protein [Seohaeicola nanhaiensis]|uniref:Aspartate/glutamate racemase family protein n=1 Tax=Seohaeicola nanhaiensis TaxID=1387282 RepID=A0ABV9KC06_9RHOB
MKRVLVVNPNSSEEMTSRIDMAARLVAPNGFDLTVCGNPDAPEAIEGALDGALAEKGVIRILDAAKFEAALIACFDDTGVDAARGRFSQPVIGIGAAACHMAALSARRFLVVTPADASVPVLEENLRHAGLDRQCLGVFAAGVRVLDFEEDRAHAFARVAQVVRERLGEADAVVLGCAGMTGGAAAMSRALGVRVIDPVQVGVTLACALAQMEQGQQALV